MKKMKVFGVSNSLSNGIRDTLTAVENNLNNFRFSVVNLNQIELDPENPRDVALTIEDIKNGIENTDPLYSKKQLEYKSLTTLADTIRLKGVINPIVLYKFEDKYRLIAGERRCLAACIAKKNDVQARILSDKPTLFDLRLLQWIENNEREDLSLKERLVNIKAIIEAYKQQFKVYTITATNIKNAIGISLSQAAYYHQVLGGTKDLLNAIENDQIKNLDKAAIIAGIKTDSMREQAINACAKGATLKEIKKLAASEKNHLMEQHSPNRFRGRVPSKINLGTTTNIAAIKSLILTVMALPDFNCQAARFRTIKWANHREVTQAFKEFLSILEEKSKE